MLSLKNPERSILRFQRSIQTMPVNQSASAVLDLTTTLHLKICRL